MHLWARVEALVSRTSGRARGLGAQGNSTTRRWIRIPVPIAITFNLGSSSVSLHVREACVSSYTISTTLSPPRTRRSFDTDQFKRLLRVSNMPGNTYLVSGIHVDELAARDDEYTTCLCLLPLRSIS